MGRANQPKAGEGPGPLSHSSAQTLLGCEQKYWNYKIAKLKPDPDYEKSAALSIGSAVHWILENSRHEKPKSISGDLAKCTKDPDILLDEDHYPLVHAMVLKYLRLHKKMDLKVLEVEFELRTDSFLGYVDALMEDGEGKWWIVDVKTYKSLYLPGLAGLRQDPQLNLYAAHKDLIAEKFDLDPARFGGVRWRVVTKSTAKQKNDSYVEFVKRLVDKFIKGYDVPVPVAELDPKFRLEQHTELWRHAQDMADLHEKGEKFQPTRNFGNCMSFFQPCQYWSKCFGKTHTELSEKGLEITEEI